MTRDEAVKMCARYHSAIHNMRTFSSTMNTDDDVKNIGAKEAQEAEDAIVNALVNMSAALEYATSLVCMCHAPYTCHRDPACEATHARIQRKAEGRDS